MGGRPIMSTIGLLISACVLVTHASPVSRAIRLEKVADEYGSTRNKYLCPPTDVQTSKCIYKRELATTTETTELTNGTDMGNDFLHEFNNTPDQVEEQEPSVTSDNVEADQNATFPGEGLIVNTEQAIRTENTTSEDDVLQLPSVENNREGANSTEDYASNEMNENEVSEVKEKVNAEDVIPEAITEVDPYVNKPEENQSNANKSLQETTVFNLVEAENRETNDQASEEKPDVKAEENALAEAKTYEEPTTTNTDQAETEYDKPIMAAEATEMKAVVIKPEEYKTTQDDVSGEATAVNLVEVEAEEIKPGEDKISGEATAVNAVEVEAEVTKPGEDKISGEATAVNAVEAEAEETKPGEDKTSGEATAVNPVEAEAEETKPGEDKTSGEATAVNPVEAEAEETKPGEDKTSGEATAVNPVEEIQPIVDNLSEEASIVNHIVITRKDASSFDSERFPEVASANSLESKIEDNELFEGLSEEAIDLNHVVFKRENNNFSRNETSEESVAVNLVEPKSGGTLHTEGQVFKEATVVNPLEGEANDVNLVDERLRFIDQEKPVESKVEDTNPPADVALPEVEVESFIAKTDDTKTIGDELSGAVTDLQLGEGKPEYIKSNRNDSQTIQRQMFRGVDKPSNTTGILLKLIEYCRCPMKRRYIWF